MAAPQETDPNSSFLPPALRAIANEVGELLKSRKETISVVETAAGGLISAALLSVPGASQYYLGGLTLYTLPSRIAFSHWTPDTVKGYSGPTPSIVAGLAEHARTTLKSTYAVSESGTAGPTGGNTRNRTPGYVALAVAGEGGTVTREVETGKAEREGNMVAFAIAVLELIRDVLKGDAKL
ncbi:Cytochrome P450 monooxygenase-like protein [Mycena venus]|uniref:Cytochrome P450 monooxygenase-like protein n=1 Tax=Mycena venus TaxID=2733690 RepID=A0A8H7DER9_9AGAR|nr:Cytochrome P450 monooxygenase-like protein [Mycena venus]